MKKVIQNTEKYLKEFAHKIVEVYRNFFATCKTFHEKLLNEGYYRILFFELCNVCITGFLISIALIPFMGWRPVLSISFGLLPWVCIQLVLYFKREWIKIT